MGKRLDNDRTMTNRELFKKLFVYLKPFIKHFVIALLLILVAIFLELQIPLLYQEATKEMIKLDFSLNKVLISVAKMAIL